MANAVNHHESHVTPGPAGGTPAPSALAQPQRRGEAHQAEARDSLVELLDRSRAIARQASSTLVAAFKDVMADPAVAGGFAVESARDLVQYLLRRGELAPADAERLLKLAESAAQRTPAKRVVQAKPVTVKPAPARAVTAKPPVARTPAAKSAPAKPVARKSPTRSAAAAPKKHAAPAKPASKPAAKPATKRPAAKSAAKPRVKKARR